MVKHYRKPKKFHSKYRFTNILCYVPKRYGIMGERQRRQRAVVDDFKNGNYDDALCQHFERIINTIINITDIIIEFLIDILYVSWITNKHVK